MKFWNLGHSLNLIDAAVSCVDNIIIIIIKWYKALSIVYRDEKRRKARQASDQMGFFYLSCCCCYFWSTVSFHSTFIRSAVYYLLYQPTSQALSQPRSPRSPTTTTISSKLTDILTCLPSSSGTLKRWMAKKVLHFVCSRKQYKLIMISRRIERERDH